VVRCFTALVEADAGTLASLQAAHGVTAVITLLLVGAVMSRRPSCPSLHACFDCP